MPDNVIANVFGNPAFNMASLTGATNILPNLYGRLNELDLFPFQGIATRAAALDVKQGVLALLPSKPVGSPGTAGKSDSRSVKSFNVPHIPHDDAVMAADVDGIRAFGSANQLETVASRVNEKLQTMKNKVDITLEFLRMGALKGVIVDGDGATVLVNLYSEFGITQKAVDFKLGTATTNVKSMCLEVKRHIEKELKGEIMSGVRVLVSPEFYDKLTSHQKVEAAYAGWQAAQDRLAGDMRKGFAYGGLVFEEYPGEASDSSGAVRRFIAADEGHAFPEGTSDTFRTYVAPADYVEAVNTIGIPYYAKQERMKFDKGVELQVQSNPLPICKRPAVLVKVFSSN